MKSGDFIDITLDSPWDPSNFFDDPTKHFHEFQEDDDDHAVLNTQTMPLLLVSKNKEMEASNDFHDTLKTLSAKEVHGHAMHLDIDHTKGTFAQSDGSTISCVGKMLFKIQIN